MLASSILILFPAKSKITMPDSCCAIGCTNRREGENLKLPFYKIPKGQSLIEQRRRQLWIRAIRRSDWGENQISRSKVCGAHFISGKRSDKSDDPDWVPSIFNFLSKEKTKQTIRKRQQHQRYEVLSRKRELASDVSSTVVSSESPESLNVDVIDLSSTCTNTTNDASTQCNDPVINEMKETINNLSIELRFKNDEILKLKKECEKLKRRGCFCFDKIKHSDSLVNFFTGIATVSLFMWIIDLVKDRIKISCRTLSISDHVLIVFMKLRLAHLNQDIANRFNINSTTVSTIFRTCLPVISKHLQNLIIWPDRQSIRSNLPLSFRSKFRDAVCTIDCSEVFIERPSHLTARSKTWSNYKHHNTIKYLIGITPAGAVSFLSGGWGGRVSDKQITLESLFLDKLLPGDCVLADRGFLINKEVRERGAILKMPSFTKGKSQLSGREVDESRQLARVRIHVERVIGRLKDDRILQTVILISQADMLDYMMSTICACINLNKSVVRKGK